MIGCTVLRAGVRARLAQRGQAGGSLLMVLALITFIAIVIPAALGIAFSGASITTSVKGERRAQYAAVSALEAATQHGRTALWVGRYGIPCPTTTTVINGVTATVTCTSTTGPADVDRPVSFVASVGGVARARSSVIYRDSYAGPYGSNVDVVSWDADLLT